MDEEKVKGVVSMNENYELKWLSNMTDVSMLLQKLLVKIIVEFTIDDNEKKIYFV